MFPLKFFFKENSILKAGLIFTLIILFSYSTILFLGQSYNESWPMSPQLLGYSGKTKTLATTIDPAADFMQNWPVTKLATTMISEGKIPLWNPYIATGHPLAADPINYIMSPLMLGYLLPVEFWDVVPLIAMWFAGFFTFLFLRTLGLNFPSSIAGGIFYMLSGAFTWYLPHPHIAVIAFTPFILYSLENLIQHKNSKYLILTSIAFFVSILGAHPEALVLQFLFVGLYFIYRISSLIFKYFTCDVTHKNTGLSKPNLKKIILWTTIAFIGGLGLSAFFILPTYEFLRNAYQSHDIGHGLFHDNPQVLLPAFVPYSWGTLHTYLTESFTSSARWDSLWGYVGVLGLFFSILGIINIKNKLSFHRFTPIFFLSVTVFFLMKTIGVPIVNWIGYLPILDVMIFTRYAGVIIPFGFAVSAAFGINYLTTNKVKTKTLAIVCLISTSLILLLSIPLLSHITSDVKFTYGLSFVDIINYVGFQLVQSIIFLILVFFISISISKNKSAISGLILIIVLELSLYIPFGLSPIWMFYKSIIVLCGMAAITILTLKPNRLSWNLDKDTNKIKYPILVFVFIVTLVSAMLMSNISPTGMYDHYDTFQENALIDFLRENLGTNRIFSFDYILGPNYPAAYKISTIGIMSAVNIDSFYSFNHNFLDQNAWTSNLGYRAWSDSYGPINSFNKFEQNKKYFDFLGVKYLITTNDLGSFAAGPPRTGSFIPIDSKDNSVSQSFVSPYDEIIGIGVSFGTYLRENQGHVVLTIDSIPFDEQYHRESVIDASKIKDAEFNKFLFSSPLTDSLNKKLQFTIYYPDSDMNNKLTTFTYTSGSTGFDIIKEKLKGEFYMNHLLQEDNKLVFSIINSKTGPAFKFENINIFENKDAFPRVFLVSEFTIVESDAAQDYLLHNPDFDLRNNVILEKELVPEITNMLHSSNLRTSKSEITSYQENTVHIKVNSQSSSLLILTDTFYPGWKAYIDGVETEIYRADGLVRAVFVPAGTHTVEFSYMPDSFVHGVIISLVTAGILLGIFIFSNRIKDTQKLENSESNNDLQ